MRKHRSKFSLHFKDGIEIQTMKDLRENFDIKRMIEYFKNEKLISWLLDRLYENEVEELKKLNLEEKNFAEKLCEVFNVNFDDVSEQLDDPETVAWRNERRAKLKKITSDKNILKEIDNVAFNQDDLEDIFLDKVLPEKIYLCGERFIFPSGILNKKNISYIGVGSSVCVEIDSNKKIDFEELNISFKNIFFDEKYKKIAFQDQNENFSNEILQKNPEIFEENAEIKEKEESYEKIFDNPVEEIDETEENYGYFERTTTIKNQSGVHAMPATLLVKTADAFKAQVSISAKGKTVNAKNILVIMGMGLIKGTEVKVIAEGFDAKKAVDTLIDLIDNKFGED